jgi:hypothetical protein
MTEGLYKDSRSGTWSSYIYILHTVGIKVVKFTQFGSVFCRSLENKNQKLHCMVCGRKARG